MAHLISQSQSERWAKSKRRSALSKVDPYILLFEEDKLIAALDLWLSSAFNREKWPNGAVGWFRLRNLCLEVIGAEVDS